MRVVIVEDEFFVSDHLRRLMKELGHKTVGVFYSGEDFLKETDLVYDVALVDIQLAEELTGIDVGRHLQENEVPFIFLTANKDEKTLWEAAELRPSAYLSKPFNENDISVALQIINMQMIHPVHIRDRHGLRKINAYDILFIKSENVYVNIVTKAETIVVRKLLKEMLVELPAQFERVHRSYVVNTERIHARNTSSVTIEGHTVPISEKYRLK